MGTVKSVESTAHHRDKQKKDVTVAVDEQTKFEKSGAPATLKDVTAGERVVFTRPSRTSSARSSVDREVRAPQAPAAQRPAHDRHTDTPGGPKKPDPWLAARRWERTARFTV